MSNLSNLRFVFFGTGEIARIVCDELAHAGLVPSAVVTAPDAPAGRGKGLEASPIAQWAQAHSIPTYKPQRPTDIAVELRTEAWDVFVVADYRSLIGEDLRSIPAHGCLNVHPSLLPRLRGASPIRSAILSDERTTGVSIIVLDAQLDHGPVVAQKKVEMPEWPMHGSALDELLAREGGILLARILPLWLAGDIDARPQNDDLATICEKFNKEDGLLDLAGDAYKNLLKIRAFEGWPGTYAYFERAGKKLRVQILDAHLEGARLVIERVKPEGKGEMAYADFARSGAKPLSLRRTP